MPNFSGLSFLNSSSSLGAKKAQGPFAVHKELVSSSQKPEVLRLVGILL